MKPMPIEVASHWRVGSWVPIDKVSLVLDDLRSKLSSFGYCDDRRTIFSWEGVVEVGAEQLAARLLAEGPELSVVGLPARLSVLA